MVDVVYTLALFSGNHVSSYNELMMKLRDVESTSRNLRLVLLNPYNMNLVRKVLYLLKVINDSENNAISWLTVRLITTQNVHITVQTGN